MKFSLRFLFASRGKYALLLLGMSSLWLWLWLPLLVSSPDDFGKGCGLVACLAIEGAIISGIYDYEQRSQSRRELQRSRETSAHLYEHLAQLPNFSLDYWCVLAGSPGEVTRALAIDTNATRIAILDYSPSKSRRIDNSLITAKIVKAGDVVNVVLEESSALSSPTMWDRLVGGEPEVRLGGFLREADGTYIRPSPLSCGEDDSLKIAETPIAAPAQKQKRRISKLNLNLTLRGAETPVEYLDFLLGEVEELEHSHRRALANAGHWQALFEEFRVGATSRGQS